MTTAPGPVFLSYSRIDLEFALRLAAALKNAGVPVWVDRFELLPGGDWRRGVEAGLAAAAGMICVLSPDYVTSKYCLDELATVDRFNVKNKTRPKPLFPVAIRPVPDERQPLEIRRLQHVHLYDRDRDWRDENLFDERLRQLLNGLRAGAGGALAGDPPGREEQYLNGLVAELETRRGVTEFVELAAEARAVGSGRPAPTDDEFGYAAMLEPRRSSAAPVELATVAEAAGRFDRFVLLGEPGAGKTTALRRLARAAARERLGSDRLDLAPLPLLLYLPQWTTEPTPAAFVRARWQAYGLPPGDPVELARAGEVALYLDGLNEMGADGPRKAALLADWVTAADGPRRVTVTCRVRDYLDSLRLGEVPTVTVRELDESRVRQFAANYLRPRADDFLARVLPPAGPHRASDPRRMSTLVVNPYLLGALVYLFEQSPGGDLPANNGALFRSLARALWQRERQRGTAGWRPFEEVEGRFAALAFAMIDDGRAVDVPEEYAAEKLGDAGLVRLGLSASFLQGGDGTVRFYHQLFQEYFAGVALLGRDDLERFVGAYEQKRPRDQYAAYITPVAHPWDEPLTAACGVATDRAAFAARVGRVNPRIGLGGLVGADPPLAVVAELAESLLTQTERHAQRLYADSNGVLMYANADPYRASDAEADAKLEQLADLLLETGQRIARVGRSAVPALAGLLRHPSVDVRVAALEGLQLAGCAEHRAEVERVLGDWTLTVCASGTVPSPQDRIAGRRWPFGSMEGPYPVGAWAARCLATYDPGGSRDTLRKWVTDLVGRREFVIQDAQGHPTAFPMDRSEGLSLSTFAFVGPPLLPALYDAFDGGDDDARIPLAEGIGRIYYLHRLPELPSDPRVAGIVGLVVELFRVRYSYDEAGAPWLVGLLANPHVFVRYHACLAVAHLFVVSATYAELDPGRPTRAARLAAPALRDALADEAPKVRLAAVRGLVLIDLPSVVPDLERRADDADESVRAAAADGAKYLGRKRPAPLMYTAPPK